MSRINIDINILEGTNPNFLSIADTSIWGMLESNPSVIHITLPGYSNSVTNFFTKATVNVFNAFNLDILCSESCKDCDYVALPDGIYNIRMESHTNCNFHTEIKYLRTTILERELDQIIISNTLCTEFDKEKENLITEIEFLIKSAKANLRYDNVSLANQLYKQACKKVEKIKRCK